jgi:hypothetical protein
MRSDQKRPASVPRVSRPPSDGSIPPLRKEDVTKNDSLRGRVVRGGVGAVPSVWEDQRR